MIILQQLGAALDHGRHAVVGADRRAERVLGVGGVDLGIARDVVRGDADIDLQRRQQLAEHAADGDQRWIGAHGVGLTQQRRRGDDAGELTDVRRRRGPSRVGKHLSAAHRVAAAR